MRFTISATAVLAMAMSAFAQTADFDPIYTPEANAIIEAGSTFDITWAAPAKYAEGTVSISLIGGATQNTQVPLQDIASGVPNSANKYTWTVDASLGADAVYGLVVRYESSPEIFQYSNPFHIKAAASQPDKSTSAPAESTEGAATTVTTQHGAVTVTLSSCTTSEEAVSTSAPVVTSSEAPVYSTPVPIYTTSAPVHQNTTLSTVKPVVPSTSVTVVNPPATTPTGVIPPPASAASARSVSGALAVVAGFAMAMLAL